MSENELRPRSSMIRMIVGALGVFLGVIYWSVIFTFPGFFLFNPFENTEEVRKVVTLLASIGWFSIATAPIYILGAFALGHNGPLKVLPFVALWWPTALVINHLSLYLQKGTWYTGYILEYPVFIVTDIAIPALLIFIWQVLKPVRHIRVTTGDHLLH